MGETISKCFVDVESLPDDGFGFIQLLTLLLAYGYVVVLAADGIGSGCELLMAHSPKMEALVGPVVLPTLGAVPDSMIILFSGLGEDAQEKLNVGVGALAGSTIMLLTIPWFVVIFAGRVDLDDSGQGSYQSSKKNKKYPGVCRPTKTGINVTSLVPKSGKVMLMTSLSYLVMQIPALALGCGYDGPQHCDKDGERWWALGGLVCCAVALVAYIWYCIRESGSEEATPIWLARYERLIDAKTMDIIDGAIHLAGRRADKPSAAAATSGVSGDGYTLVDDSLRQQIRTLLKRYWNRVDKGRRGKMNQKGFVEFLGTGNVFGEGRFELLRKLGAMDMISFDSVAEFVFHLVSAKQIIQQANFDEDDASLYSMAYRAVTDGDLLVADREKAKRKVMELLEPIWKQHSNTDDGNIDTQGFRKLFPSLGLEANDNQIHMFLDALDSDMDNKVSIEEMATFLVSTVSRTINANKASIYSPSKTALLDLKQQQQQQQQQQRSSQKTSEAKTDQPSSPQKPDNEDESEGEDEDFELPTEIAHLPKSERQKAILHTSLRMIAISTIAVIIISDPITDVLSELGSRIGVSPFYVSFILAPLASNGSELGAAYTLASRKTQAKATAGIAQLLGAGCMNNTLCLGVFLALIFFRRLSWTFTAETISILSVEVIIAFIGMKTTQTLLDGYFILAMFPLSIALVAVLETVGLE